MQKVNRVIQQSAIRNFVEKLLNKEKQKLQRVENKYKKQQEKETRNMKTYSSNELIACMKNKTIILRKEAM